MNKYTYIVDCFKKEIVYKGFRLNNFKEIIYLS